MTISKSTYNTEKNVNERMRSFAAIATFVVAGAAVSDANAQAPDSFYKGRPIELHVGAAPGGSYDLYGRLVARYIGKHIPGTPAVVVRNMPGAGGYTMTNWVFNVAPRDGTVLAIAPQAIAIEQALGQSVVQYDARKFTWIGRVAPVVEVTYTWRTSPTKSLADARKHETIMGGSGASSPTSFYLTVLNRLAGTRFKVISSYPSNSDVNLAMMRGEVEGGSKAWASLKVDNADWLRNKQVNILVQYADERAPTYVTYH